MTSQSLTGDPDLDRLIPIAMQLVGAVRMQDQDGVAEALEGAGHVYPGPSAALCVLLAAMVPWELAPSELLAWFRARADYETLVIAGVDPAIARTVIEGGAAHGRRGTLGAAPRGAMAFGEDG